MTLIIESILYNIKRRFYLIHSYIHRIFVHLHTKKFAATMKILSYILFVILFIPSVHAQSLDNEVKKRLADYFATYETTTANIGICRLDSILLDHNKRCLDIYAGGAFGYQSFTPENTAAIIRNIVRLMPGPVNYYNITVYADKRPIDELVPNILLKRKDQDPTKVWNKIDYKGKPWVSCTSNPIKPESGLTGRHLAVWQSHGRYYKNATKQWSWQRPRLFCTTEDLFTQSFVIPYIIPMLENAGAIVYTPRERDTQRNEVIIDNNGSTPGSIYYEERKRRAPWNSLDEAGFANVSTIWTEGMNPFTSGTSRYAPTAGRKKRTKTMATWIPDIPETGAYAVYVSYATLPKSIPDAHYTVFHKGGTTEFRVNQQIGGGTWVYLGTFEFDRGQNDYGFVALSNESDYNGFVSADAVRFGGGMGNVSRDIAGVSGLPRHLEGARYWAQWAGMPYEVYAGYKGTNDYADDINTRSRTINHLAGGSVFNPTQKGLGVPFEMTLGLHSDAGFSHEDKFIGSLGIYTTDFNDGKVAAGISRYSSRDMADIVLNGLKRDLSAYLGHPWAQRGMWNRNYSESRIPTIPSMILEILSHQNFADLRVGHDPNFKFTLGRSVYKSILRYTATMHDKTYVVQPLPVDGLAIRFTDQSTPNSKGTRINKKKQKKREIKQRPVRISWNKTSDPLEPTAEPTGYVVYTRIGYGGWDNGVFVNDVHYDTELDPGVVYSFKVTATNDGGESFPSEIMTAYEAPESQRTILIVNGFDRLSGPATIETQKQQGFDLRRDPGVPYIYNNSYCGVQIDYNRENIGIETAGGLGFSGSELEGMKIAGNTFDYTFVHGKALQAFGGYSFVSCSDEAIERETINMADYDAVDLILGLEKRGGYAATNREEYKTFSIPMQKHLTTYLQNGGRLMVSGAYIGTDMINHESDVSFTANVLKYSAGDRLPLAPIAGQKDTIYVTSIGKSLSAMERGSNDEIAFTIPRTLNETNYAVTAPEYLIPTENAFPALVYGHTIAKQLNGDEYSYENNIVSYQKNINTDGAGTCAAIAYKGTDYRTYIMGFPFESIRETNERTRIMGSVMNFLTE